MRLQTQQTGDGSLYLLYKESTPVGQARLSAGCIAEFSVAPAWRRHGYGSYLLKELLRQNGGYARGQASLFTAPLPAGPGAGAALAFAAKFGFAPAGGVLVRRCAPDLTAVEFTHRFLRDTLAPGGFYIDATCGNGHDTEFLCRLAGPAGQVLALDVQPAAAAATNARLAAAGLGGVGRALCADHRTLAALAAPGTADCVLFNFGWLPGADHAVFSTAESSLPALRAALTLLKPGGVLAAVLYSGKTIGSAEKQAARAWFRALPPAEYTVLECAFANWADTAPLPCFALKKVTAPP